MTKIWLGKWLTARQFLTKRPLNRLHKEHESALSKHALTKDSTTDPGSGPETEPQIAHDDSLCNHHWLVRKNFFLEGPAEGLRLDITADDYYKLYVNGTYVGQGPAQGYHFHYYYNTYDLSNYLKPGHNTIAVHVFYHGMVNRAYNSSDHRQGVIAELIDAEGKVILGTDDTWKSKQTLMYGGASVPVATAHRTQYIEQIDARSELKEWNRSEYDDTDWEPACVKTEVDYQFALQPTPVVDVYRQVPAVVEKRGKDRYWIDFGQEITGAFTMRAQGRPGEEIFILYGEELWEETGAVRDQLRCDCDYRDRWTLSGAVDVLEPFDYKGFRYVEVHGAEAALDPDSFAALVRHYPYPEEASHFASGDERLERIWQLCANTVRYATQEHFVDCPTREKGQYLGDNTVTGYSHLFLTGDLAMYRKSLTDFALSTKICPGMMAVAPGHHMQEIADYSLQYPQQLLDYYDQSGDLAFLRAMQPVAEGILEHFEPYRREDGLLEQVADKWNLVDWPMNMRDGYNFRLDNPIGAGCHNVINAFYYGAMCACDEIRALLGMEPLEGRAEFLHAFQKAFWRADAGLFADAELPAAESSAASHSSLHSNTLPLLFGMIPEGGQASVVKFLKDKKLACGVYFSYFYLTALARAGERAFVYDLILTDEPHELQGPHGPITIRGYWNQMLEEGATTCFESWSKELKWNTSLCHPWASAPIPIFIAEILRLRPAQPGWTEVSLNPPSDVNFPDFHLKFTTVNGPIEVICKDGKIRLKNASEISSSGR